MFVTFRIWQTRYFNDFKRVLWVGVTAGCAAVSPVGAAIGLICGAVVSRY
jgi:hypothetical protein